MDETTLLMLTQIAQSNVWSFSDVQYVHDMLPSQERTKENIENVLAVGNWGVIDYILTHKYSFEVAKFDAKDLANIPMPKRTLKSRFYCFIWRVKELFKLNKYK